MGKEVCENCVHLQKRIEELERRLTFYENAHTPPSRDGRRYPKREPTGNPAGAPKGHQGATRPIPQPDEIVDVKQERCSSCSHRLGKPMKILKRIIEDIPEPQPIKATQYNVHAYLCRNCAELNIASHPDLPAEGRFGYNLMAEVASMKYEDRLPYMKIADTLNRRYHLSITPATILNIIERVAYSCEPAYEKIRTLIAHAWNVCADETGQKVQGKQWWTWVFTNPEVTLFLIRKSRGQTPIEEVLGNAYAGILNCDGWRSYPQKIINIQRCWAHLLREAKWLAEKYGGQAKNLSTGLHELFNDIKKVRKNASRESRNILYARFVKRMRYWIGVCSAYRELRKFATKVENGLDYWFTCVLYHGIEPTNNRAERALREMVVQRKITGTLRNEKGTHMTEVLMSCIQTWKLQGLNTFSMLRQTLSS